MSIELTDQEAIELLDALNYKVCALHGPCYKLVNIARKISKQDERYESKFEELLLLSQQ